MKRNRVLFAFGTRPEAIKLAPVILELRKHPREFEVLALSTGQHRQMLDSALALFGIRPDFDLGLMRAGQSLGDVVEGTLRGVGRVLREERPGIVLVEGDTASAFAAALAAFHERVPVGHVEAGLRTNDKYAPFPEEMYRRLVTPLADIHFAPTAWARGNLLREGVSARQVHVTGNPVIDALRWVLASDAERLPDVLARVPEGGRIVLVTAHRRESFGAGFESICRAIAAVVRKHNDVHVIYPVHLNPNVCGPVNRILGGQERIHLVEPMDYLPFVRLMERAYLVLTDSGGIQEEAPALGKPVLVLRDMTERPEAVQAGTARLVGTNVGKIVASVDRLLDSPATYRRMARVKNPYGDGRASRRIAAALRRFFARSRN